MVLMEEITRRSRALGLRIRCNCWHWCRTSSDESATIMHLIRYNGIVANMWFNDDRMVSKLCASFSYDFHTNPFLQPGKKEDDTDMFARPFFRILITSPAARTRRFRSLVCYFLLCYVM